MYSHSDYVTVALAMTPPSTMNDVLATLSRCAGRTKWDCVDDATRTRLNAERCDIRCAGCNELLTTEGDFARHFLVPDVRYMNLGYCPNKGRS